MKSAVVLLCIPLLGSASRVIQDQKVEARIEIIYESRKARIPPRFRGYIEYECTAHGVPAWLVANLIEVESGWNTKAVSSNSDGTRDFGLMQLNSAYIAEFSWRYRRGLPFDPLKWSDNVAIGVEHLSILYRHTGSWNDALIAYNAGLKRFKSGRAPKVSKEYARKILSD